MLIHSFETRFDFHLCNTSEDLSTHVDDLQLRVALVGDQLIHNLPPLKALRWQLAALGGLLPRLKVFSDKQLLSNTTLVIRMSGLRFLIVSLRILGSS